MCVSVCLCMSVHAYMGERVSVCVCVCVTCVWMGGGSWKLEVPVPTRNLFWCNWEILRAGEESGEAGWARAMSGGQSSLQTWAVPSQAVSGRLTGEK